jgi:2-iminobutanoate/2-iminopropanoate deaminase
LTTSAILAAAGAVLTDVVRVGVVTRDLQRDRPVFNPSLGRAVRRAPASPFGHPGARPRPQSENARFMIEVAAYRG